MAATTYHYSIQGDFPNHVVNTGSLQLQVQASAIVTAIDYITTSGDDCSIVFKDALSVGDKAILDGLVAAHTGAADPIPPVSPDGSPIITLKAQQSDNALRVAITGRDGEEWITASHNFADKTTWFSTSVRYTNEAMTDSGDGLTWTIASARKPWVDLTHGKVLWEDDIHTPYLVAVKVDGVTKTEDPMYGAAAHYSVDYVNGTVTFHASQAGKAVTVSYSHVQNSTWIVRPESGKKISIEEAEIQLSADLSYNDVIRVSFWGYVIAFAPQLAQSNGGPLPDLEKIELRSRRYLRHDQIIDEAKGAYPHIGAIGGPGGHTAIRYGYPMIYKTVSTLYASAGMELRGQLENDITFGGERATVTFYGVKEDE